MRGLPQKQNARRAYKIRLCGHLRRYKKIVKKTYIIYFNYKKEFYGKMFKDSEIAFVYVYIGSVDIDKLTLQKEELDRVDWFNLEYVYEECKKHNQKFCAPIDGLEIARKYVCEYGI